LPSTVKATNQLRPECRLFRQLCGDPFRLCFCERLAIHQLEHERATALGLFESIDGGDVRMIERGENVRFPFEALQPIGVRGERRRQDLDATSWRSRESRAL